MIPSSLMVVPIYNGEEGSYFREEVEDHGE